VLGITLSREQSCRQAEPVIMTVHLFAFNVGFEVAAVLVGAAKADAQIAIDMATVANFVTVVMGQWSARLMPKASRNETGDLSLLAQKVFEAKSIQSLLRFIRSTSSGSGQSLVNCGRGFPLCICFEQLSGIEPGFVEPEKFTRSLR
jgi:hypothetical protein